MRTKVISVAATSFLSLIALATPAAAHIGITPGINASGSSTSALTAGQSGTLNFRVGHGCTLEKDIVDPSTGKSLVGTKWPTRAFSVDVPAAAQGTGTTIPKPAYVPGWKTKVVQDSTTKSYTVTWTANSSAFYLPDGPEGTTGANSYFDFGISIKWSADQAGKTVYFKSVQTCPVSIPGVKATKSKKAIKTRIVDIFNSWDVTDGSGKDTVADEVEHNTAPSVKVIG